jgi:argininosuccinate synthase
VQPRVTGSVRLKLFKGDCRIVGRKSAYLNVAADMLPAAAPQVV